MMVDIDNDLYEQVKIYVECDKVEYPTIKNFIDKSIRTKLERIRTKQKV